MPWQCRRAVQMLLPVGTALAAPTLLVKGLGCCGMENALLYLLQNLMYYSFPPESLL